MKFLSMGCITISLLWFVKNYLKTLHEDLTFLRDWVQILTFWKNCIQNFSCSVDELIQRTYRDPVTYSLKNVKELQCKNKEELLDYIQGKTAISEKEKSMIISIIKSIGHTTLESEIEQLNSNIKKLDLICAEKEKKFFDKKTLLFKITPLLCGTIILILW